MKKTLFSILIGLLLVGIFVYAAGNLNIINPTSIDVSKNPGETVSGTFTIENTGVNPIVSLTYDTGVLTGSLGGTISNLISGTITDLATGTRVISYSFTVPIMQADTYTGANLTVTDDNNLSNTANIPVLLTINSKKVLDVKTYTNTNVLVITSEEDNTEQGSFIIQNLGSVALSGILFDQSALDLSDGSNDITVTFSNPGTISPGQEATVTVTADVDKMELGKYGGILTVKDVSAQDTFKLEIRIQPQLCDEGPQGNYLEITDIELDEDEYKPGDIIGLEVEVANDHDDDVDVVLEAFLYNENTGKKIETAEDNIDISDTDEEVFTLELEIPIDNDDFESGDNLVIFMKAYEDGEEDNQCVEDSVSVDIALDDHDVIIKDVEFLPSVVECGSSITASIEVYNIGKKDEDVRVSIKNTELGIEHTSETFDLDDYDGKDYDAVKHMTFTIPENAKSKEYQMNVIAIFDDGDERTDIFKSLTVDCGEVEEECTLTCASDEVLDRKICECISLEEEETVVTPSTTTTGRTVYFPTTNWFGDNKGTTVLFIILDIVLVIIAIYFIILIAKKR